MQKFQALIYKNVEFRIFCPKTDHGYVFIYYFFSPGGHRIDKVVLECRKRTHFNGNEKL